MNKNIILSGNCYWCLEAVFQKINGINNIKSGFYHIHDYSYSFGEGDKLEVISIDYDDEKISLEAIMDVFFNVAHTPTIVSWEKDSVFPLCRSAVFVHEEIQKSIIADKIKQVQNLYSEPVYTKVDFIKNNLFKEAPEKEQNYYKNNPIDGYCLSIINPKLTKLNKQYSHLIK